jgi:hypothetical protein
MDESGHFGDAAQEEHAALPAPRRLRLNAPAAFLQSRAKNCMVKPATGSLGVARHFRISSF